MNNTKLITIIYIYVILYRYNVIRINSGILIHQNINKYFINAKQRVVFLINYYHVN